MNHPVLEDFKTTTHSIPDSHSAQIANPSAHHSFPDHLQNLPQKSDLHLLRKIWHISTGLFVVTLYYLYPEIEFHKWGIGILTFSLAAFTVEFLRLRNKVLNQLVLKAFGPFLRHSERNSLSGLPFYALGCACCIFFFEEKISILSILFLIFADPFSSLFGVLYGKDKIFRDKSFQGSLAGFSVCYLITLLYGLHYHEASFSLFLFSLIAGLIGSLSELFSTFIDDNLTIPIVSGFGLTLLNKVFLIF